MSYEVVLDRRAERKLRSFSDSTLRAIRDKLNLLSENQRPPGCQKLTNSEPPEWKLRTGDVRILYYVDDSIQEVRVFAIEPRDKVYKKRR